MTCRICNALLSVRPPCSASSKSQHCGACVILTFLRWNIKENYLYSLLLKMSFRTKIGGMVRGFQDAGCFGKNNGIRDISGKHLWNMRYLEQVKRDTNEGIVKFCICGIRKFNRIWDTRGEGCTPHNGASKVNGNVWISIEGGTVNWAEVIPAVLKSSVKEYLNCVQGRRPVVRLRTIWQSKPILICFVMSVYVTFKFPRLPRVELSPRFSPLRIPLFASHAMFSP